MAGFCGYMQTTVDILLPKPYYIWRVWLNWGTGAWIQGSFLSTCPSTMRCVQSFIFINHCSSTGRWLYCFVHVCVRHIASHGKATLWIWDNYLQNQLENIVSCITSSCITMQLYVSRSFKKRERNQQIHVCLEEYTQISVLWKNRPPLRYQPAT